MKGDDPDMSILSKTELETLIVQPDGPCVSLYMPTHRAGDQIRQDPVVLKNLLDEAEQQLIEQGWRAPDAKEFLDPIRKLIPIHRFWRHQSDGLAIFYSPDVAHTYRLPLDFEKLAIVGDRFYLKPLLSLLSGDGRFYLLALSQGEIRLLQGTRYSIAQVDLDEVPDSLYEVLKWDDPERQLQWHTATGAEREPVFRPGEGVRWGSMRSAVFHGHGYAQEDDPKEYAKRYFDRVDEGVCELLAGEQAPLVVAGVDYLHPIYQEASSYQSLLKDGIVGNPEHLSMEELHQRVWPIVQPVFEKGREEAGAQFGQLAGMGSGLASHDLQEIVASAYVGRIETLWVAVGIQQWGTFDPDTNEIHLHSEAQTGDLELLDLAAVYTLLNDGTVYAVEPEQVPGHRPAAAVFRYELESELWGGE